MPVELVEAKHGRAHPIHLVGKDGLDSVSLDAAVMAWAKANGFSGETGRSLIVPGEGGAISGVLFGAGNAALATGALAKALPEGDWAFATTPDNPTLATLGATDKRLVVVPNCGHMMPIECGPSSAREVLAFLDRVEAVPAK